MRIKLVDGKYDGKTLIVPDGTVQYRPEGTKEIAYENQAYRIGFDVIFKLIEMSGGNIFTVRDMRKQDEFIRNFRLDENGEETS